jgi:CDP-6-deoxy-D-xylo-4-hexulose-3-dehydrase
MNIKLVKDTIDSQDINNLIEWLKTNPKLTKGELTVEFEKYSKDKVPLKPTGKCTREKEKEETDESEIS